MSYYDLFLLKNRKKLYKTNQKHKEYFSPKESCAMIIRRNNFPFKRMKASPHLQFIAFRNHIGDFFDSVKIFQTDITYLNI